MLPWRCLKSIVMVSGRILSGLDDDFAVTGLSSGCRHWTGHGNRSFCLLLTGLWEIGLVAGEHLLPLDGPGKQELLLALEAGDAAATGLDLEAGAAAAIGLAVEASADVIGLETDGGAASVT